MTIILAMAVFALSMSISPGPVNLITLSTGANHGLRRAMPFVTGASLGFSLLLLTVGLGIGRLAEIHPVVIDTMSRLGMLMIAYLGYRIASSTDSLVTAEQPQPGFIQGMILQWLNPKAWIACASGISAFGLGACCGQLSLFVSLYFVICYLSISTWALLGQQLGPVLAKPNRLRRFNRFTGGSLIMIALYLLVS